jgi:hypothetical protein
LDFIKKGRRGIRRFECARQKGTLSLKIHGTQTPPASPKASMFPELDSVCSTGGFECPCLEKKLKGKVSLPLNHIHTRQWNWAGDEVTQEHRLAA